MASKGLKAAFVFAVATLPFLTNLGALIENDDPYKFPDKTINEKSIIFGGMIKELPKNTQELLTHVKKADENLNKINDDMKTFTKEMYKSSNRVAFGLILTALLISRSPLAFKSSHTPAGHTSVSLYVPAGRLIML